MAHQKTILITGGGSGIGRETARLFASKNWLVGIADVNGAAAKAAADEIGPNAVPLTVDVRNIESVRDMVAAFTDRTGGRLDVLFNSAGVVFMAPNETIPQEQQDLTIDVNIKGVVNCCNAAFKALKSTPGAHVISMSSTSAEYGTPDHAIYSGTKFFVRGFTEAMNIEWARHDINVSAILVAYVQTPMILEATQKAASVDKLGVKVKPTKVAQAVWKAAHKRGVLHRVGLDAVALNIIVRLLGSWSRGIYKLLTGY
jgi:NAD(P)-dependent dehydrogenase (short-subunit alcohol dehydrogenase family)